MTQLPGIAGEIEAAIGLDATVTLLRARGGTEIEVPVRAKGSLLVKLIGLEAAETLIETMGPGRLTLPCASLRGARAREAKAMQMLRDGASNSEVALACDMHVRTAGRLRKKLDAEKQSRQGRLDL